MLTIMTAGVEGAGMLCKWISAAVPPTSRGKFAAAQRRWSMIRDQPGLIGQLGGWHTTETAATARILSLWTDQDRYRYFMQHRHDAITGHNRQSGTYTSIEAIVGEVLFTMPGDTPDAATALADAAVLRVADCQVVPGRDEHFSDVQRNVWASGMAAAGGMLIGYFAQPDRHRYLVATLWSDPGSHRRYSADVPFLRAQANLAEDVHKMASHVLLLEPSWRVLPTP